jgi:hypothetical protein
MATFHRREKIIKCETSSPSLTVYSVEPVTPMQFKRNCHLGQTIELFSNSSHLIFIKSTICICQECAETQKFSVLRGRPSTRTFSHPILCPIRMQIGWEYLYFYFLVRYIIRIIATIYSHDFASDCL